MSKAAGKASAVRVIAKSVLVEAVRRKEIYVIILLCCALIGVVMTLDFFGLDGLVKFYREVALKLMGVSTAIAVVLLATRQLPREFEFRTIYPLLARPVGRLTFLIGKGLGVCAAAAFCFGLFMILYVAGILSLGGDLAWGLFVQHIYLQMLLMMLLTSACFLLSLLFNYDAALVMGLLLYSASGILSSTSLFLYDLTTDIGRLLLIALNYLLPQLVLFDLSEKVLHSELWGPVSSATLATLTVYALAYTLVFTGISYRLFRRRPL
ncbi:MAG: ABC transporter permease [Verrucomicrobia bacterium]|nr:ABC transporter permease [Verrucomicrobiota bacterium]MCH8529021.1 ABC transporter permease subunit [Kiritimatiellia bacterium]